MGHKIWKTLFSGDFDDGMYLYYYTNLETAKRIISSNQIDFYPLNSFNDFAEEKVKLNYIDESNNTKYLVETELIKEYFNKRYEFIQLLSFSQDFHFTKNKITKISSKHTDHEKDKYFDVSGRGFSIPFMWAKFKPENNGVCFIINKHNFDKYVETDTDFILKGKVRYFDFDQSYDISEEIAYDLLDKIKRIKKQKKSFAKLIRNNDIYLKYNFFSKKSDWKHENEYRYISFKNSSDSTVSVGELDKYLEGIVINDNIDSLAEEQLNDCNNDKYKIKRISFCEDYVTLL